MTKGYQEKLPGLIYDYGGAVFNIQHKDFGFEQNGSWDSAFIAAIAALPSEGGIIVIPPSKDTYTFHSVDLGKYGKQNIHVIAYGAKLKKQKVQSASEVPFHMFYDQKATCDGFIWEGGDIDISKELFVGTPTVSFFFGMRLVGLEFRNIYIHNGIEEGLKLYKPQRFRLENLRIDGTRNDGIQIHNPEVDGFLGSRADQDTRDGFIVNNHITNIDDGTHGALDGQGIAIHGTSALQKTRDIVVQGNVIEGCVRGILAEFNQPGNPALNLKFDGNIIRESESHGINLTGTRNSTVNGNSLYNIGKGTSVSSELFGIILSGSADPKGLDNISIGNTIIDDRGGSAQMQYGMIVRSQQRAVVRSNHIYGALTKPILAEWGVGKVENCQVEEENVPNITVTRKAAGQTISIATWTDVSWDTKEYEGDTDAMWVIGTPTKIYLKRAGMFDIEVGWSWGNNAVGFRGARIILDDGTTAKTIAEDIRDPTTADDTSFTFGRKFKITEAQVEGALGIFIRVQVYQSSGGDLTSANADRCFASLAYCGAKTQ